MKIQELEKYLYENKSKKEEIISFLNYIYNGGDSNKILSNDFYIAFQKAYKKEKINDILNRKFLKRTNSENNEIIDIINDSSDKKFSELIYEIIKKYTENINQDHKKYSELLEKNGNPIKYIITGEAPPFSFKRKSKGELTFVNNYILSKRNAGSWQSSIRDAFDIKDEDKKTRGIEKPLNFINGLVENSILFFDIIPITLPFSTDIRMSWIEKEIEIGKPLIVSLLELAFKKNIEKLKIDPNVKVAFVTPPKTSISIFDYYFDKKLKISKEISVDVNIINNNNTKKKYGIGPNIILPMYKSNAMMGSNTPSSELLKLALDLKFK